MRGDCLYSLFLEGSCPFGPDISYPGFAEALLSRACWSTCACNAPMESMCRGSWAGHRFGICSHSDHLVRSDESWKDVSAEVCNELRDALNTKACHDDPPEPWYVSR